MKAPSHSSALLTLIALVAAIGAACGGGGSGTSAGTPATATVPGAAFTLTSAAPVGATLPVDYTCDGYQILQFSAARAFIRTETGADSYANPAGRFRIRIRFMPVTVSALTARLAAGANSGKSACWNFQFNNTAGVTTQPAVS